MSLLLAMLFTCMINPSHSTNNLITTTCAQTKYVDMCTSLLQSNTNTTTNTTLSSLAVVSLDLAMAQANATISHVSGLVENNRGTRDTFFAECLDDCLDVYSDALDDLGTAKEGVLKGSFDDVNTMVSAAMTDAVTCEDGFGDAPGHWSPVTKRNDYFQKLCSISLAITALLQDQ